jgi:hypothetical protein
MAGRRSVAERAAQRGEIVTDRLLTAVRAEVPRALDQLLPPRRRQSDGYCLAATRIGIETLRHFGVKCEPLVVSALAGNAKWRAWIESEVGGKKPEGAYVTRTSSGRPGDFAQHLVVEVDDQLLDLDSRQFSEPESGIVVPETLVASLTEHGAQLDLDGGGVILYARRHDTR